MSRQDVLDLIRALPRDEYERIVDEQLVLNDNRTAVGHLSPSQLLELRRQLVSLPASVGGMFASAQAADEQARGGAIAAAGSDLRVAFQNRRWFRANRLARRMRRMGVRDRELVELEKYTYGRHLDPGRILFYIVTLLLATVTVLLVLARFDEKVDRSGHLVALLGGLLILWWPATSSRLAMGVRTSFKVVT